MRKRSELLIAGNFDSKLRLDTIGVFPVGIEIASDPGPDSVRKVLKVVANHKCGIIWVRPWAYFWDWQIVGIVSPFDGFAKEDVGIHTWRETAMADQRLQLRAINEPAFAVLLDCHIGKVVS